MGVDFRGTAGNAGQSVVIADGFSTTQGLTNPRAMGKTTVTLDPASLATMTGAVSTGLAAVGARVGDFVQVFPPYSTQGVIVQAYVPSVQDAIIVTMFNPTAGTIDLASGSWTFVWWRK